MKLLLVSILMTFSVSAMATYSGVYKAKRGFAETLSTSQVNQQGKFRFILKADRHSEAAPKKIKITGSLHGTLDPATFTLSHILVDNDRNGAIYTAGDSITNIFAGDPQCANGSIPFQIEETLTIVAGTGIYANVVPGSYVVVEGTVNNCPGLPDFGKNDFEVTGGEVTFQ